MRRRRFAFYGTAVKKLRDFRRENLTFSPQDIMLCTRKQVCLGTIMFIGSIFGLIVRRVAAEHKHLLSFCFCLISCEIKTAARAASDARHKKSPQCAAAGRFSVVSSNLHRSFQGNTEDLQCPLYIRIGAVCLHVVRRIQLEYRPQTLQFI